MFTQDHQRDFDAVLRAERPFALVRFGDGEASILSHKRYVSADAWRTDTTDGRTWIADDLLAALQHVDDGYCVGLPMPCCLAAFLGAADLCRTPLPRLTFATLFLHANLRRAGELVGKFAGAMIVSSSYGDLRVPSDGVSAPWDIDAVVTQLLGVDRPILLAAGPCAKVIAHRYWQRQRPEQRQTILDVGSVLDVVHGYKTRYYHDQASPLRDHRCRWILAASHSQPQPKEQRIMSTNRIRVGRPATPNVATQGTRIVQPVAQGNRGVKVSSRTVATPCPTCPKGRIR